MACSLPMIYPSCFLTQLRTTAQGRHCSQWLSPLTSSINPENAPTGSTLAALMEVFLNWGSLIPDDSSQPFCQADKNKPKSNLILVWGHSFVGVQP